MAYSKQNFQNGQILNAANLEAMENGIIAGQGAHNLLDNSDFRNPVAQAGIGGSHGSEKYVCDRWLDRYGCGTYSLSEGVGITLSYGTNHCYCTQRINNASQYYGKTMTLAAQLSDGTIYIHSGTYLSSGTSFRISASNWLFDLQSNGVELVVMSGSITIAWAALYEGAYDASTLPAYQPKGYAAELAECQMYYYAVENELLFSAWADINGCLDYTVLLPQTMRAIPTVTFDKLQYADESGYVSFANSPHYTGRDRVAIRKLGLTPNKSYGLVMKFSASADL